ncbi:hypothetical protein ACFP2T_19825 [Plantactinospora solaniradicis]|uniref:Uncharacterized protein n=1 Tax=Plantactinospora solaniradicis TaxID=1723736 RepID=A0ABW1K9J4_9ACTN
MTAASSLFILGCVITFLITYGNGHFMAEPGQLARCAAIVAILVLVAIRLPKADRRTSRPDGWVPDPWLLFAITMVADVVFRPTEPSPQAPESSGPPPRHPSWWPFRSTMASRGTAASGLALTAMCRRPYG